MLKYILVAVSIVSWIISSGYGAQINLIQLKEIGHVQPKNSREISDSYWGIQIGSLDKTLIEKATELGVKWTRLRARWEKIEQEKGKYDWKDTDEAFEAVLKYGITPFVTLGNGNRLYSGTGNYDDPKLAAIYGESPAPPVGSEAEMEAWLNFVGAVVNRYKDKIQYWEIWNEPNHRRYWGAPPNGEDYGKLVKVTSDKIRSIQPNAKIIAGSMAGIKADYADAFLSQCDPQNIDIISFHNYAELPEDRVYRMPRFLEVIKKYNPDLELWQGECGYPSHSRTTGYRAKAPWGLNIQAKWLLRQSFVDIYFCNATLSNYFLLAHEGTLTPEINRPELTGIDTIFGYPERGGSRVHSKGVNQKCILFREDNQPKPAFFAYQNLCAIIDKSYRIVKKQTNVEVLDPGIFYGIGPYEDAFPSVPLVATFQRGNGSYLLAHWLPWHGQEYLPKLARIDLTVQNVEFSSPVLVDLLTGKIYKIDTIKREGNSIILEDVPLADYPMIITELDNVPLVKK